MSVLATVFGVRSRRRVAVIAAFMMVVALVAVVPGPAAAHNPACKIPGQGNGDDEYASPHYPYRPDGDSVAPQVAFDHNPNLRDPVKEKSLHPDHANSIHNIELSDDPGTVHAPRHSGEDCHN